MAGSRIPGPLGLVKNTPKIDEGTLCLLTTPPPGPVTKRPLATAKKKPVHQAAIKVDRTTFFGEYARHFTAVTSKQRSALSTLLGFIEADPRVTDIRWAAYILATARRETAHAYAPIEEYGKGATQKTHRNKKTGKVETWYGTPVTVTCSGKKVEKVYYGRGYVQLTWKSNYEAAGKHFGMDLVCHPEFLIENASLSYKVMSYGMTTGKLFANGHKLSFYLNGSKTDYFNARQIVNGHDHAAQIADWAKKFEDILSKSLSPRRQVGDFPEPEHAYA